MRFPAEFVQLIRTGKVTATVRRYEGRTNVDVGTIRAIQKVDDVRVLHDDGSVHYERRVGRLDLAIEVLARYSLLDAEGNGFTEPQLRAMRTEGQVTPDVEPAVLDRLPQRVVAAAGFDELGDLVDYFRASFGGPAYQRVWVFEFQLADRKPLYMAKQNGLASPPQYTQDPSRAIDDSEVIDHELLEQFAKRGRARHARFQKKDLEQALKACRTPEERQQLLIARAREAGVDVRNELRSLERRLIQKIEQRAA